MPHTRAPQAAPSRRRDRTPIELEPLTIRIADASRLSGLGRSTIYRLMDSGRLENVSVGRSRLINLQSLQELVRTKPQ